MVTDGKLYIFYHNKKIIFEKGHQVRHLRSSPRRERVFLWLPKERPEPQSAGVLSPGAEEAARGTAQAG